MACVGVRRRFRIHHARLSAGLPESGDSPVADPLPALFAEFSQFLPPGGGMGQGLDAPALLASAGFVDIGVAAISVDLPVPDGQTYWRWGLTHGSLAYFEDLPADRREQFRQRLIAETDALGAIRLRRTASFWNARKP